MVRASALYYYYYSPTEARPPYAMMIRLLPSCVVLKRLTVIYVELRERSDDKQ
jgi:hypothetical protein